MWKLQLLLLLCVAFSVIHHINFFFTLPFSSMSSLRFVGFLFVWGQSYRILCSQFLEDSGTLNWYKRENKVIRVVRELHVVERTEKLKEIEKRKKKAFYIRILEEDSWRGNI